MPQILKISDGTTTVDFVSSTSGYTVTRWNPAIANRRSTMLGGRGPYADVVEEMVININGTTPLEKLGTLRNLLEQAERWQLGENVAAVLLHYQPTASSTELKSTILGADGREPMVEVPPNLPDTPVYEYIEDINLRFRRLGMWLGASVTGTSAEITHPATATISFTTSVDVASPITLKINEAAAGDRGMPPSFVLMASGATTTQAGQRLLIFEAEELNVGALSWTTAADSTNDAGGGIVLRYTPQTAATWSSSELESVYDSTDTAARTWGMFLNYRSNGTSTEHRVRAKINGTQYTKEIVIPAGTSNPTWTLLDTIRLNGVPLSSVRLQAQADNTAGTLDFDTIALLALDDEITSRVVRPIFGEDVSTVSDPSSASTIDHRLLSKPSAAIFWAAGFNPTQGFLGDATLTMRGAAIAAAWLSTSERSATAWRPTDSGGSPVASTLVATRLEALLTPE